MLEKDKLRKADIFSGLAIFVFGLWIVFQATKMPMKDSWGGVQNVWFVSPALFPLFVGAMIALLGALLVRTALKTVGFKGFASVFQWCRSVITTCSGRSYVAVNCIFTIERDCSWDQHATSLP